MKNIRKFETSTDVKRWQSSETHISPNVILVGQDDVLYNIPFLPPGVFIQHVNGELYTIEQWTEKGFAKKDANGVAIRNNVASFVIAKYKEGRRSWSSDTTNLVDGILTSTDYDIARTDFAGYNNTQLMLATDISGAGYTCANYTFPNGQKGYLPALGELVMACENKDAVNEAMTLIGGEPLDYYLFSSTQVSATSIWLVFGDGTVNKGNKSDGKSDYIAYARPFTTL